MPTLYEYIGEQIRNLRKSNSLSQEEFGEIIGTQTNTVSRWETATYKPSANDLESIAKKFNITIAYFFPEENQPTVSKSLQALMSATADLNESDIQEITEYAMFRKARSIMGTKKKKT